MGDLSVADTCAAQAHCERADYVLLHHPVVHLPGDRISEFHLPETPLRVLLVFAPPLQGAHSLRLIFR